MILFALTYRDEMVRQADMNLALAFDRSMKERKDREEFRQARKLEKIMLAEKQRIQQDETERDEMRTRMSSLVDSYQTLKKSFDNVMCRMMIEELRQVEEIRLIQQEIQLQRETEEEFERDIYDRDHYEEYQNEQLQQQEYDQQQLEYYYLKSCRLMRAFEKETNFKNRLLTIEIQEEKVTTPVIQPIEIQEEVVITPPKQENQIDIDEKKRLERLRDIERRKNRDRMRSEKKASRKAYKNGHK